VMVASMCGILHSWRRKFLEPLIRSRKGQDHNRDSGPTEQCAYYPWRLSPARWVAVWLSARGDSSSRCEKAIPAPISGVPKLSSHAPGAHSRAPVRDAVSTETK
jgi:hypothetical protein